LRPICCLIWTANCNEFMMFLVSTRTRKGWSARGRGFQSYFGVRGADWPRAVPMFPRQHEPCARFRGMSVAKATAIPKDILRGICPVFHSRCSLLKNDVRSEAKKVCHSQFDPVPGVYKHLAQSSSTRPFGVMSSNGDALCSRLLPVDGGRKHVPSAVTVSKEEQHAHAGR